MKIVFFGPSLSRSAADHRSRILLTLLEGVVDGGHHVVYVEPSGTEHPVTYPASKFVRYDTWEGARDTIETECADASAIVVVSGFPAGASAVEYLLELPVPARAYYELDPWQTLEGLESEGAAPWVRADQIPAFHIVFSIAGGPGADPFRGTWGAEEVVTLYEAIDSAIFHPRSPSDELACDLALVADRHAPAEAALEEFLLAAATELPSHRFLVSGNGWDGATSWPANVELLTAGNADARCTLYSSARVVLVAPADHPIDYALTADLLEPTACGAACAVVDRPGLASMFVPDKEILVPTSSADIVRYLTTIGDNDLLRIGNLAEKRVVLDYVKLRAGVKFEQRLARKFYRGHNG